MSPMILSRGALITSDCIHNISFNFSFCASIALIYSKLSVISVAIVIFAFLPL